MAAYQPYDGGTDGMQLGADTSSKVAFHGGTVTSRRSSSKLTAGLSIFTVTGASVVAATTATITGLVTFTTTQMIDLWDAVAELRALLVEKNLHKGGA